jgi:hypothetical protein
MTDENFPGDIKITDLYFPSNWTNISGGMGVFDPSFIKVFEGMPGTTISGLVHYLLTDLSIAFPTTPINSSCDLFSSYCASFLIPGGVATVSPWPWGISDANDLDYIIKNGPAYQLDFGEARGRVSWPSDACEVYGSGAYVFQLCIENDQSTNELIGGEFNYSSSSTKKVIFIIQFRLAYLLCRHGKCRPLQSNMAAE